MAYNQREFAITGCPRRRPFGNATEMEHECCDQRLDTESLRSRSNKGGRKEREVGRHEVLCGVSRQGVRHVDSVDRLPFRPPRNRFSRESFDHLQAQNLLAKSSEVERAISYPEISPGGSTRHLESSLPIRRCGNETASSQREAARLLWARRLQKRSRSEHPAIPPLERGIGLVGRLVQPTAPDLETAGHRSKESQGLYHILAHGHGRSDDSGPYSRQHHLGHVRGEGIPGSAGAGQQPQTGLMLVPRSTEGNDSGPHWNTLELADRNGRFEAPEVVVRKERQSWWHGKTSSRPSAQ